MVQARGPFRPHCSQAITGGTNNTPLRVGFSPLFDAIRVAPALDASCRATGGQPRPETCLPTPETPYARRSVMLNQLLPNRAASASVSWSPHDAQCQPPLAPFLELPAFVLMMWTSSRHHLLPPF